MKSSKTLQIVSLRNYKHGKCLQYAAKEKVCLYRKPEK